MLGKRKKLSKGGSDVTEANAFKEVVGGVAKTSHSKRQRVDFGSSKNRFGNSELSHELQSIFLHDGRDCVARLNMERNGECPADLQSMKSCIKDKTDGEYRTCIICKHGGKLLCCVGKGCKRRYHISCLDPPLNDVPPGVWHCVCCVKRKIELGVHSVSKEIESIWDVREVASDHDALQCQKQYMVKYHGFAHVHNCWIQETQLLLEAPKLVTKFNKKRQVVRWRAEWTVPHRLVHKRMLLFPKQCDEFHDGNDNNPDCCYEWLVKWTGLGYEHATWELDNASFFTSPEAMKLMSDYESRHEKAEILLGPHKADEEGKPTFHELSELSFGDSPGEHSCHLNFVNNLREHWHKGKNAIVFDDHGDQSIGGSGRDSVGDILVDFVHQRFGKDSYVSLDGRGYAHSTKQAALNMFNDKENGKFVFLIEIRACLPSIRLSAVDTIILFGSDWDPQNDLRALHRISISSQFEQLKVFRLYTSCTLEEKVLILAKEGMALDSNIHSTNPRTYTLLRWGASYLFNKLDGFHSCSSSVSGSNISPEQSLLGDVMHELSTQLPYSGDNNDPHSGLILKVELGGGGYARNLSLFGEREMQFVNDEPPTLFWKNLLEGRDPQWNFLSGSSQRVRRKVHYLNESPKESEFERSAVIKKSRKLFNNKLDTIYLKSKSEDERKLTTANKAAKIADNVDDLNQALGSSVEPPVAINKISQVSEIGLVESEERNIQLGVCQSLPPPEISELCEILQLPVNVKDTAVRFLEYEREKFNLSGQGISTLQAFLISLCWVAASLSEHSIDHIESIALAKLHLNYVCKEAEVDYIYSKLEKIKKSFACCLENAECVEEHCAKASKSTTSNQQDVVEGKTQRGYKSHPLSDLFKPATVEETPDMVKNDSSNSIKDVLDNVDTKMEKCMQNQQKEVQEFHKKKMEEKAKLEEAHRLESALIRTKHSDISVRLDKLRLLDHNLKEKIDEHNHQMEIHLKTLEASQLAPRFEEQQIKAIVWLGKPKSGVPTAISDNPSWSDLELKVGRMQPSDIAEIDDGSQNAAPKGMPSFQNQNDSGSMPSYPAEVPEFSNVEKISCSFPMEAENVSIASDAENNGSEVMALKWATTTCVEQHNKVGSRDGPRNGAPVLGSSDLESSVCNVQTLQSIEGPSEVPQTLSEVIMRHEPMKMLPNTVQPNGVCPDKDAVTLDSTADTQDRQQDGEVMAIFRDSACSEFNGTWPSLVQTDTCPAQGSSLASLQPISTNPSSTEYNSLPASLGNLLDFSNLLHSAICLPLPSSIDIPAGRSEHVADRSRTTVPGPLIDHPHAILPEMPQPVCLNPLQIEMERIQKDKEQALKRHQDMILQLRYKCDKEIEEIRKKYDLLLQDAETSLMQKQRDLETFHYKVNLNKELADALIVKSHGAIGSVCIEQAALSSFTNEWIQLSSQQPHQMTPPRQQRSASPEINIPPVAPPAVVDRTSAVLSTTLGTPHSSFMIQYPRNLQNGIELRAPAPHLRASPSMQAAHVSTTSCGTPNQSPRNPLATSVKLAHSIKAPPEV